MSITSLTPHPTSISDVPETMEAALFYKPGDVRYETVPVPKITSDELLVKIESTLTCGTDLKCYRRGHPVLLKSFPSPFGHEFSGIVVRVGSNVTQFKPGNRVVAANSAPCYDCDFCHKGNHNLCEHLDLLNGSYADYLRIPAQITAHNTHKLPEDVSFEAAAFAEPLAVSLRGIDLSGVSPGDHVAIIGLGSIGQLLVRLAKLKGAHVTAMARNPLKMAMAKDFGKADSLVNLRDCFDVEQIKACYTPQGKGFDIVIEAVGLPEVWEKAIGLARRGGLVNLFGGCPSGSSINIDTRRLHYDEITLISPFHHTPEYFRKALTLICEGKIDPRPLISKQLPLSQVPEALETVEAGQAIKILLTPKQPA